MSAIEEMHRLYGVVDVNRVWQERERIQAAANAINAAKNMPRCLK